MKSPCPPIPSLLVVYPAFSNTEGDTVQFCLHYKDVRPSLRYYSNNNNRTPRRLIQRFSMLSYLGNPIHLSNARFGTFLIGRKATQCLEALRGVGGKTQVGFGKVFPISTANPWETLH